LSLCSYLVGEKIGGGGGIKIRGKRKRPRGRGCSGRALPRGSAEACSLSQLREGGEREKIGPGHGNDDKFWWGVVLQGDKGFNGIQ